MDLVTMATRRIADPLVPIEIAIGVLFGLLGAFVAVVILSLLVDDGGTTTALGGLGDGPVCFDARHSELVKRSAKQSSSRLLDPCPWSATCASDHLALALPESGARGLLDLHENAEHPIIG